MKKKNLKYRCYHSFQMSEKENGYNWRDDETQDQSNLWYLGYFTVLSHISATRCHFIAYAT